MTLTASGSVSVFDAEREGGLDVAPGVRAECDVRISVQHACDLANAARDQLSEILVRCYPDYCYEVDIAGAGVNLGHAVDLGDRLGSFRDAVSGGLDEHDCGDDEGPPEDSV